MIRVIGLGSPFSDDQAGWWVIQHMHGRVPPQVDLVWLDRPGAALINWMDGVNHLLIIDAVAGSPEAPGQVLSLDAAQLDRQSRQLTSHQLALVETLDLAEVLSCRPVRVDIIGITIRDTGTPNPAVAAAASQLAEQLAERICAEIEADSAVG